MTARRPTIAEPITVGRFWRNRSGEAVYVQLIEHRGHALVDVRMHFTAPDGKMQPSSKGISVALARLPNLAAAINRALRKAIELGLIDDEGRRA